MKTKHATEIRKGVREAKNFNWLVAHQIGPEFLKLAYRAMIKRSTLLSFRAFERTVGFRED